MQLYPAWSARDNYGYGAKKKKRKKERVPVDAVGGTAATTNPNSLSRDVFHWHAQARKVTSLRQEAEKKRARFESRDTRPAIFEKIKKLLSRSCHRIFHLQD